MTGVNIEAAEVIRSKKSRMARFMDTKQWDEMNHIVLPQAAFIYCNADGSVLTAPNPASDNTISFDFKTRDDFVAFFRTAFAPLQTIHMVDHGDFAQVRDDEIKVVWAVTYNTGPAGATDGPGYVSGGGHYYETWTRFGDDWFLADLKFVTLYTKMG